MEISFGQQLSLPFLSILFGLVAGALYDAVRIFRCCVGIKYRDSAPKILSKIRLPLISAENRERKINSVKETIIIGITDILYFFILTVFMCVFVYAVNNGKIRWFIYFFSLIGFFAYYFTVGKLVIGASSVITFFIRALFLYIFLFLFSPIRILYRCLRFGLSRVRKNIKRKKKNVNMPRTVLLSSGKISNRQRK